MGIGQHHQNGGCAVHGVAVGAHDGGVHPGQLGTGGGILHDHDLSALASHSAGGVGAGLQYSVQLGIRDLPGLVGAAAAAAANGL